MGTMRLTTRRIRTKSRRGRREGRKELKQIGTVSTGMEDRRKNWVRRVFISSVRFLSCFYNSLISCSLVAITPFLFLSAVLLLPHSRLHLSCYSVDSLRFQSSLSFEMFSQLSTFQISRYAFHSHSLSLFHLPLNYHPSSPHKNSSALPTLHLTKTRSN